jgi:hypothetical protein
MPEIAQLGIWIGEAFIGFLLVVVATQILTGNIRTRGLIAGKTASGAQFVSGGRVQLLIATLTAAAQYLAQVMQHPQKFPDIPQSWLWLLGGSQLLYQGAKLHGRRTKRFYV